MKKKLILSLTLLCAWVVLPLHVFAQGCIISRECAPEFGMDGGPYLMPSQWQLDGSFRYLDASKHYNGTNYQIQRDTLGTFVMNRQRILDLGATYGVTDQFSANITIPYLVAGEWGLPLPSAKAATPTSPATQNGPRANFYTSGLGDISINAKYWLLNTKENMTGNIQVSAGIKIPTGNDNVQGNFPNITGKVISYVSADQSIQPGDGGWGIPLEIDAFKSIGRFTGFMTAAYLINPRDTNNTPSILISLGITPTPNQLYEVHNTVQDQYLFKIGVAYQITDALSISVAGRVEGVPVRDLIGRSDGFRRPGDASFIESGIIWNSPSFGSFSASVPVTITRDRAPDAFGNPGDATFANYIVLVGYSYRL
jgi:hypothetical protein